MDRRTDRDCTYRWGVRYRDEDQLARLDLEVVHLHHHRRHPAVTSLRVPLPPREVGGAPRFDRHAYVVRTGDPARAFDDDEELREPGVVRADIAPGLEADDVDVRGTGA